MGLLKGIGGLYRDYIGFIKGDTRSLDYGLVPSMMGSGSYIPCSLIAQYPLGNWEPEGYTKWREEIEMLSLRVHR